MEFVAKPMVLKCERNSLVSSESRKCIRERKHVYRVDCCFSVVILSRISKKEKVYSKAGIIVILSKSSLFSPRD